MSWIVKKGVKKGVKKCLGLFELNWIELNCLVYVKDKARQGKARKVKIRKIRKIKRWIKRLKAWLND